jgi:hypothetical protein
MKDNKKFLVLGALLLVGIAYFAFFNKKAIVDNKENSSEINFKGEWSGSPTYKINDVVEFLGKKYIALKETTDGAPNENYEGQWKLL